MNKVALKNKTKRLQLRKLRIRKKISGTADRPRVSLYCSNERFYAQAINDDKHHTVAALSSSKFSDQNNLNRTAIATQLGVEFAEKLKKNKISTVVFDRNGKLFHGRIKAFVMALKDKGIIV